MSSPAGQAAVSPSSLADVDPALNLAESSYPWRGDPPAAAAPPTVPRVPFRPVPSANFHAEWSPGGTPGFRIGNTSFRLGQPLTHRQLLDFQAYAQDLVQELQLSHQALTSRDAELQAEVQQLKQQVVELLLRLERSQVEADDLSALMDEKDRALRELRGRWEAAERQLHAQLEETARHAAQLEELNGRLADSVKEPARKPSTSPPDLAEQVRRLAGLQRAVEAQLRAGSEPEALLEQARGEIEDLKVELMGTTQLKEIIGRELSNWMTLVANHTEAMHPLLSAHDRRLRGLWEGYGMPPLEVTPSSPRIDPSVGQFNQQMALLHDLRTQVSAWSQPMEEMLSLMPPGASLSIRSANGGLNVGVKMKLLQARPTPAAPRTEPPRPPAELRVPQLPPPPPPPVPVEPPQPAAEPTPPPRPPPTPTRVDAATQTSPTPTPPTPPDDDPVALKQQLRMAQARATVYQAEHVQLQALASGLERRLRARLLGAAAAADRPAGSPGAVGTWEAPGDVRERLEAVTQLVEEWPIPTPPSRTASPCPSSPQRSPPTRQGMRLRCPVCHTVQPVQPATPPDATTTLEPDACAAPGAAPSNPRGLLGAQASSSTPDVAAADAETAVLAPTMLAASRLDHTPNDAAEEVPVAVLTLQQLVEGTDVEPDDPFQPSLPVDPSSSEHPSGSLRLFYAALDPALSAPASDAPVPLPLNEDPPAPPASTLAPHHDEDRLKEQLGYVEGWFRRKARLAGATTPPATAAEEPAAPAAPGLEATPAVPGTPHHWFSGQVERIAGLVATLREAEAEAEAGPPTVPPPPEDEARLKEQLGIVEGWFHHKARLAGATTPPATAAEEPVAPAAPGLEATPAVPGTPHHWFSGQVERIAGLVTALKEAEAEAEAEPPAVPPPPEDEARLKEQLGIVEGWFHRKARLAGATTPPATAAEEPVAPAAPGLEAAGVAPAVPGTPHHWFSGQVDRIVGLVAALREAEAAPPTAEEGNLFSLPPVLVDTNATNAGTGNKSDLLDSQTSVKFLDVQPPSHRSSGALPPSEGAASEAEVPEAQFQKCLSELGTMSPAKVRLNLLISNMEEAIHRLAPTHPSDREISVFGGMEPERGAPSPNSGNSIVGRLRNLAEKVESNFQKSGEIEPEDLYTVPSLPSCGNLSEGQHRESGSFEGPMSDAVRLLLDIEDVVWRKMGSASVEDVANPPAADTLHTVSSVRSAVSPVQEMADRLRAVARLVSTTTAPAPDNSPSPSPVCVMEAPLSRERSFEDVSVVPSVSQPDVTIPPAPAPAPPAPAAPPQPPTPPAISVAPATIIGTAASTTATPPATPAPTAAAGSPPPSPPPAGQAADDLVDQIVRRIEETLRASGKQPTPVVDAARSPVSPPATPPPVLHRLQSIVRLLSPAPSSPAVEPAIPAGDDHASPDTGGATEVPVLDLVTSPAATSADASAAATAPGPTAAADPAATPASPALEERRQLDAVLGALEQLVRSKAGGEPAPATTEPPPSSPVDPSAGPLPEAPAPDAPEAPEATGDTIVGRLETLAHLIHSWVAAEPASSSQTKVEPGVAVGSEPEQPADNAPTAVEAPSADPEQPCLPQPPMPQPSPLAPSTYLGIEISREDLETGAGLANGQAQSRKGLTVAGVRGPAELAGLKPKDIVMQVDDQPTNSVADFAVVARGLTPGQVVAVHVLRGLTIAVRAAKVGEPLPPPPPAVGLQDRGTSPGLAVQEEPSAHGSASVGIELAKDGRPSELPSVVKVAAVRGTARDAQVMVGDVILAFNDRPIDCVADYRAALKQVVPGETVTLKIIRGSRKMRLLVIATKAKKSKAPRRGSSPRLTLHPPGSLSSTSPRSARSISPRRRPAGSRSSTPAPGRPRAPR